MIYVDADACPVKPEVLKVAERHGLEVIFVANSGLRPSVIRWSRMSSSPAPSTRRMTGLRNALARATW